MQPLEVVSVPVAERPHWGSVGPFVGRTMHMQNRGQTSGDFSGGSQKRGCLSLLGLFQGLSCQW